MNKLFILLFSSLIGHRLFAAACCGGGVAAPSMILGDDRAILSNTLSHTEIRDDVSASGVWRKRQELDVIQTYRLEGAHILQDRYQVGASLPLVSRSRGSSHNTESGLGDISLTTAYEFLPEWDYSSWRPKGLGFLQLTLPTGKSIYEAEDPQQLEARGRGFWALGAGAVFTKIFGRWDVFASGEGHRSFSKKVRSPQAGGDLKLRPGWGGSVQAGLGYNTESFRLGTSLQWLHEDEIRLSGALQDKKALERFATLSFTGSYLWSEEWSTSMSYADQSVMGSPRNTSLGQVFSLQVQRKWAR